MRTKYRRRSVLRLSRTGLLIAAGLPLAVLAQQATDYPTRPVKILVGYQAGGPTDLTARLIAARLQTALGQPFVVENKPGAGSNIASEQLAASPPDGYTLMVAASQTTWNSILYKGLKYDPVKSFAPISKIMASPAVLVTSPQLPVKTVGELLARARKDPGKMSFASTGNGSVPHLTGELLKAKAGVELIHVPYRGAGPAMTDLLSGQVDMAFMTALSAMPFVKDGKLQALAVTSEQRLRQLPDVPTLKEAGVPGVDIESWNGMFAPAGTPPAIVQKLNAQVVAALQAPDVRKSFEDQAATVVGNSPAEFAAQIQNEVQKNGQFIRSINLKVD